ncbi:hypothetical protein ACTG23_00215 [Aeromonas enteropelogenes]|uniref:hypothetical protein n=1 Tax=Aeromonas TaxID=642 RepID=UPI0022E00821|nr:hypothetical protein [Aeromonas sp. Y293-4]
MNITDYVRERLDGASQKELQAIVDADMSQVDDDPMAEAIAAELVVQAKERLSAIQPN